MDKIQLLIITALMTGTAAGSQEVIEAGTITKVDIATGPGNANNWAGIYGNVTSEFIVGTKNSTFFSWDMIQGKYVYASSEELDFSGSWRSSNRSAMKDQYSFLSNATEEVEDTFNSTSSLNSDFSSSEIQSITAETLDGEQDPVWKTIYLNDGGSGFFAAPVRPSGLAYNNEIADYQMILPEDGFANDNATEYNLYVEIQ